MEHAYRRCVNLRPAGMRTLEIIRVVAARGILRSTGSQIAGEVMRMEESKKPEESWIQMPGALSVEATLAPYESKTQLLQIPADYDFLLHRITCRSDGPVLLTIEVSSGVKSPRSVPQPDQAFTEALQTEYPGHLAALVGEPPQAWTQKNAILGQRAAAGDDEAFFDLIARDPRVVGSTFTVAKEPCRVRASCQPCAPWWKRHRVVRFRLRIRRKTVGTAQGSIPLGLPRGCSMVESDQSVGHRSRHTLVSHHEPLAHPCIMKIGYHAPAAARATSMLLGTGESVVSLTWELSAPRIVAFEHAEQSRAEGGCRCPSLGLMIPPTLLLRADEVIE